MPVSPEFREFVVDQLGAIAPVSAKSMFGGVGLYAKGLFFALIADDVLYFKADDTTRAEFLAAGCKPFQPYGDGSYSMSYYEVPADVLEDSDKLESWMRKAIDAAKRARAKKGAKSRGV